MASYTFLSQKEARVQLGDDLTVQLGQLTATAFAEFEGVVQPSVAKTGWYISRPGMDRELSGVAIAGGRIVSSIYVTRLLFPLGGRLFDVGMLDTVMTHPQHRRQGLAKHLIGRAIDGLRAAHADAVTLYTPPGSLQHRIYEKIGFRLYRRAVVWSREQPATAEHKPTDTEVETTTPEDSQLVRALINRFNANKDGYVILDEPLWDWRKVRRPANMPARVALAQKKGQPTGTLTFCPVELVIPSGPRSYVYLTDLGMDKQGMQETFSALLRASPPGGLWVTLAGENDQVLGALLEEAGFMPAPTEASFVYPLTPAVERALEAEGQPWYVLPESVVGV